MRNFLRRICSVHLLCNSTHFMYYCHYLPITSYFDISLYTFFDDSHGHEWISWCWIIGVLVCNMWWSLLVVFTYFWQYLPIQDKCNSTVHKNIYFNFFSNECGLIESAINYSFYSILLYWFKMNDTAVMNLNWFWLSILFAHYWIDLLYGSIA